jgi:hypothetical protein
VVAAGVLSTEISLEASDETLHRVTRVLQESRETVITAAEKMDNAIMDASLSGDVRRVVSYMRGLTHGIALSERSMVEVSGELRLYAGLCLDLYMMRRWSLKRRRGFRRLAEAIASSSDPSS